LLWACKNLSSFPDPTKSVWEQDPKVLEALMYTEEQLQKMAEAIANEHK